MFRKQMFRSRLLILAAVQVLMLALLASHAAASPTRNSSPAAGSAKTVKFAMLPGLFINLPIAVAESKGFFTKVGINAERVQVRGGAEAMAALASGSVNFTYATVEQVARANDQGLGVRIVVGNHVDLPYALLVNAQMSTPNAGKGYPGAMADLKGKKIAITTRGADSDLKLRSMLAGAGLDPEKDVTIVQGGSGPEQIAGFLAGQYDAIISIEPVISTLVSDRKVARILLDLRKRQVPPDLKKAVYNGWIVRSGRVEDGSVRAASAAIARAIMFMRDPKNRSEVLKIAEKELPGTSPAVIAAVASAVNSFRPVMTRKEVLATLTPLNKGVLKNPQTYGDIVAGGSIASGSK